MMVYVMSYYVRKFDELFFIANEDAVHLTVNGKTPTMIEESLMEDEALKVCFLCVRFLCDHHCMWATIAKCYKPCPQAQSNSLCHCYSFIRSTYFSGICTTIT